MPVDVDGNKQELAVEAMEGDVILKLLLVRHFKHVQPNITRQQLHDMCQARLTNDFLAINYGLLTQTNDLPDDEWAERNGGGGPVLPPATGNRILDATRFEAWVAGRFEYNSECLMMTGSQVLPFLGLRP